MTWLSYQVFGGAPWALRLPNVAAGIGFIVSAGAIARRANSPIVGFAGFVVMVANPYLLDYLALSRGYGLALCLLTACVYNLLCWFDEPPDGPEAWRRLARGVWLAAIAVPRHVHGPARVSCRDRGRVRTAGLGRTPARG